MNGTYTGRTLLQALQGWLCALMLANVAFSQDSRGRIMGRVTDSSGAVMVGVEVTATHTATNVPTSNVTNDEGDYQILYLPPGAYHLSAQFPGFKKHERDGFELRVGERLVFDVTLAPGDTHEVVTITGAAPLLETASASLGYVTDQRRIAELPLNSGNAYMVTRLSPGVLDYAAPNHTFSAPSVEQIGAISVAGVRTQSTEVALDGTPTMKGRAGPSYIPPADMVQEVKSELVAYDASLGHAAGGHLNAALASGTNALHGALSDFYNNNVLQGLDFFQRQALYNPATGPVTDEKRRQIAPQHTLHRGAAVIGGPVILPGLYDGRNRTFWINGFDFFYRRGTVRGSYYDTVPASEQRTGNFSELLKLGPRYQIYDPATIAPATAGRFSRQPIPGNIIPASRIDPMARRFLAYWPEPNTAGTLDGLQNYFRVIPDVAPYTSNAIKVDHNFSTRHRAFVRYNQAKQTWDTNQNFPNDANGYKRVRPGRGFGLDVVSILQPDLLLNVRYALSRNSEEFIPRGRGFDLAGAGFSSQLVSQVPPEGITFPQIAVSGYAPLGTNYLTGTYQVYHVVGADLTRSSGRHTFRTGVDFRLYREFNKNFTYATPRIVFGTTWTQGPLDNSPASPHGQGLASFLLGMPTGGQLNVNATYAEQSPYVAGFFQDDWKVTPRLNVTLGIRYEFGGALTERFNRSVRGFNSAISSPVEASAKASYALNPIQEVPVDQFRAMGGLTFAGVNGQPRGLWISDKNNFSPRIGIAWSITPSLVLRGGYGIFFEPRGSDYNATNQSGFSRVTSLVASIDGGVSFAASLANPFPQGALKPLGAAGGFATDLGSAVSFYKDRSPNAYHQRWSIGLQKEFPARVLLDASYLGNRGTKLSLTGQQLNGTPQQYLSRLEIRDQPVIDRLTASVRNPFYPLLPGTSLAGTLVSRAQLLRPFPHFTNVTENLSPFGYSWYHSLQVRVERRFQSGFTIQGSYTWSKAMESVSYRTAGDPRPEEVVSPQDRPHRIAASGIWELPFGRGRLIGRSSGTLVTYLIGGWQVQALYQGQSGAPLGFGDVFFYGNLKDIPLPADERTIRRWFNVDAGFERNSTRQPDFHIQSMSSRFNGIRAPGINLWNISVLKNFRLREGMKLQFRCERLDAFNHSHFAGVITNPVSTLFGAITATSGFPVQTHFGLKLIF